jgi:hypothetical protein
VIDYGVGNHVNARFSAGGNHIRKFFAASKA